jgi:hypothetical protein
LGMNMKYKIVLAVLGLWLFVPSAQAWADLTATSPVSCGSVRTAVATPSTTTTNIVVTNSSANRAVTIATVVFTNPNFSLTGAVGVNTVIAAGGTATFQVVFDPTANGMTSSSMTISGTSTGGNPPDLVILAPWTLASSRPVPRQAEARCH